MNCFYHPDREAVNTCSRCGQPVCNVCNYIIGTHPICRNCWDRQVSTPKVDVGAQPEKSERGGATKCGNHPDVDALTACSHCKAPICPECCFYDQGKPVCLKCVESGIALEPKSPRSKKWLGVLFCVLVGIGIIGYWLANANEEPPLATETLPAYVQQYVNEQPPARTALGTQVHLSNNPDAKDVSFAELKSFILEDTTSEKPYSEKAFYCVAFAEQLHNNAEQAGIRAAFVTVSFAGEEIGHALNAFKATDRGLVYIDCTGEKFKFVSIPADVLAYMGIESEGKETLLPAKPPSPGEYDKVAYVEEGKQYGVINIDKAESLQYSFYVEYTQSWQELDGMIDDFNNEVDAFNRALGGRTTLAEPEYSKFKAWEAKIDGKKQMILELADKLGNGCFEPLGIVETVDIYW